jgi:hypothetical protein
MCPSTTAFGITPTCAKAGLRSQCSSAVEPEREQVADILEEFNPLDLHDETMAGIGGATRISPEVRSGYAAGTADQVRATAAGTTGQTEQIIPVVKEELAVGKTTSERRYRIRTYVGARTLWRVG